MTSVGGQTNVLWHWIEQKSAAYLRPFCLYHMAIWIKYLVLWNVFEQCRHFKGSNWRDLADSNSFSV